MYGWYGWHRPFGFHWAGSWGMCGCGGRHWHFHRRRFLSREEKIAELEDYLKELEAEMKEVRRVIDDLKKGE